MMILSHHGGLTNRPFLVQLVVFLAAMTTLMGTGFAQDRPGQPEKANEPANQLFARDNLIAWCIVPFDSKKRGPGRARGDARTAGVQALRLRLAGRAHPDVRRRGRGPQAARRRARRLLGRPGRAEPRVADHPRRAQAARRQGPALGPARPRRRQASRAPSKSAGSRPPRPSSARWPRRPRRSAARSRSTTTAAGSASPRTRSRSSSG